MAVYSGLYSCYAQIIGNLYLGLLPKSVIKLNYQVKFFVYAMKDKNFNETKFWKSVLVVINVN